MPSLQRIRKEVLQRGGWYESITATSGTTSTLTDTENLKDTGESSFTYEDLWIKCLTAVNSGNVGKIRRVDSYLPSSGTMTFGNPFPAAISAGDTFELDQISPNLVNSCINTALRRCTVERSDIVTYTAGDKQVNVTAQLTWIYSAEQITEIRYRYGAVANQYSYTEIPAYYFKAIMDNGSLWIEAEDTLRYGNNFALQLRTIAPYVTDDTELASDSTITGCPLDWIVPMATVELINRIGKNADLLTRGVLRLDLDREVLAAVQATVQFAPSINNVVRL